MADLLIIVFQLALPLLLLAWLALLPASGLLLYLLQVSAVALYLLAVLLVPIWLSLPWWAPWIYIGLAAVLFVTQLVQGRVPVTPLWPAQRSRWCAAAVLLPVVLSLGVVSARALSGRATPESVVALDFPLGSGTYLVASGGATQLVNGHFLTVNPKTERQRAYRGQSYALDLVKLGDYGFRASGWRPRDPAAYAIFGEPVFAPCNGRVVTARDNLPDHPVPEMSTDLIEGNHVFMECAGIGVLLAHLRQGSLRVTSNDQVKVGDLLGVVGNSGKSGEPHLHIHAQRLLPRGPQFAGDPLFITLAGRFLVRNDRVSVE